MVKNPVEQKKPIELEKMLKAVEIEEKFCVIKASDGKTYLCEQLFSWGRAVEGRGANYFTNEEKETTKKVFISRLSKNNIKPDIIQEIDARIAKSNFLADNSVLSEYTLNAYRIVKELP